MNTKLVGRTWLEASVKGPWAVDNSNPYQWGLIHTESGATKHIGPVSKPRQRKGTKNYFDVALAEANRRNQALIDALPTVVIDLRGGCVEVVRGNQKMRVIILDADTEDVDVTDGRLARVEDEDVILKDFVLMEQVSGNDGIDSAYVNLVTKLANTQED